MSVHVHPPATPAVFPPSVNYSSDEEDSVEQMIDYDEACAHKSFILPTNLHMPVDYASLYEKIRPVSLSGKLLQKPALNNISTSLYLKCPEKNTIDDEYDTLFKSNPSSFNIMEFYAYHTTGYKLFFKPDLGEVIKIAQDLIRQSSVCFITTNTCDLDGNQTDHVGECFNSKLYMHMAKTTIWYFP